MKILVFLTLFINTFLYADATIEIAKSVMNQPIVAVENGSEFNDENLSKLSNEFFRILINDLKILSHFKVRGENKPSNYNSNDVNFENINTNYVLKFKLYLDDLDNLTCETKIVNVANKIATVFKTYKIKEQSMYPFLAHKIVKDFNNRFDMEDVDWLTKYIIFSRYTKPRHSKIIIADYTLQYQKVLIDSGLNLFPKWANDSQEEFYFTRYEKSIPTLYKMNIVTGDLQRVLQSSGMLACSDVSKDGTKLLLTMAPKGQTDIYLYNVLTKSKKRLTKYPGIDVSAHFINDETKIAFVSDRTGFPNIFAKTIADSNNSDVEQLVYYGRNNNSCSSYKNYIIYSSRETDNVFSPNTFNLHLISTETDYVRRLTAKGINQFPNFSDDGESILYVKYFGKESSLGIIRLNYNKTFLFPLNSGKIQSIDW